MRFIVGDRSDQGKIIRICGILLGIFILSFTSVLGQPEGPQSQRPQIHKEKPPIRERIFFGGSFGLQFGTFTDIEFAPIIGLWVLPRVGIAAGPNFRYYKDPFDRTAIYGGKAYVEYIFLQDINNIIPLGIHAGLFLHAEYEALSLESSFFKAPPYPTERFITNTILAGGGIRQPLGARSSLNFTLLWALNQSEYGIYSNPEIRISVIF